MSKDDIIAELRANIAELQEDKRCLLETLQLALAPKAQSPSTERTRRWRERHRDGHGNGHSDAPPRESNNLPVLQDGSTSPPNPENGGTKTHSGSGTSRERHGDAFDRERAEADATARGLVGTEFEAELQRFTDYWDSAGWKRKGGAVKDRNATWRSWLDSPFRQRNGNGKGPQPINRGMAALEEWSRRMEAEETCIEGEVLSR